MSPTFRSLRVRNYRLFAGGQVVSLTGTWAQRVAQDWLVLELSGGSGVALGVVTGLQFAPTLLLSLYGGVLADRYDKRLLLLAAQSAMGVLALVLGVLVLTDAVQLWHVYVLATLLGVATAVDIPVRQAFVVEIVGSDDLPNALALNSATFNSARIVGPAVAGLAINAVGTGPVFLANALSYVAVLAALLAMRVDELTPGPRAGRTPGQLREGLRYVRERPGLYVPIALVAVIGSVGLNFQLTLALIAKEVFGRGAGSFGLLSSMLAVGALLGALGSARRTGPPRLRVLFGSAAAFGLFEVLAGLAPSFELMALLLVPTGAAVLTFTTTANATVQLGCEPHVRGRVMALYILVFLGGTPIGAPLIGALAEVAGPRASMYVGGTASLLAAVAAAAWLARARSVSVRAHLGRRRRPHVHVRPLS